MVVSISLQSTEARCSCTLRCSVKAFCTALTTGFVEMCKVSKASKPPAFPWLMWSFNHDAFTRFFAVKKVWPSNMCVYTYIYIYTHLSFVYIIHGNPPAKVYLSLFCGRDTPFTHVYIYIYTTYTHVFTYAVVRSGSWCHLDVSSEMMRYCIRGTGTSLEPIGERQHFM